MWTQGVITTDDGDIIGKLEMTLEASRTTDVGSRGELWQNPESLTHHNLRIGPFRITEYEFFATGYFLHSRLASLSIRLSQNARDLLFGLEQCSADKEREFYRHLVERQTGRGSPATFTWGKIGASEDHWACEPHIYVKYA